MPLRADALRWPAGVRPAPAVRGRGWPRRAASAGRAGSGPGWPASHRGCHAPGVVVAVRAVRARCVAAGGAGRAHDRAGRRQLRARRRAHRHSAATVRRNDAARWIP